MKFAYIALIAAVSAAEKTILDYTTFPAGASCVSTGTDTGCDEGSNCAKTPLDDAARGVLSAAALTAYNTAIIKTAEDCEKDIPAGCKAESTAAKEADDKESTRVDALTGADKTAYDAE